MAVSSIDFVTGYTGNGVTTAFAFSFKVISSSDLRVYLETGASTGLFTLKTLSTHYTVTFDATAETGTVTFLTAPPNNYRVVITRVTPTTQGTNLDIEGRSPAKTLEGMVDKVTMLAQEALEKLGRAALFRVTPVDPDPVDMDRPTDRRALIWEDNGDGTWTIVNSVYDPDEQVAAAAASAAAAAVSAAAAAASAALFVTTSGLIADRPAAPSVNTTYYATDTGELALFTVASGRWHSWP